MLHSSMRKMPKLFYLHLNLNSTRDRVQIYHFHTSHLFYTSAYIENSCGCGLTATSLCSLDSYSIIMSIVVSPNISFKNNLSLLNSSYASLRLAGNCLIPSSLLREALILKISSSTGSIMGVLFLTPSNPAAIMAENARYGLHEGSGALNSILFISANSCPRKWCGILIIADLLPVLHAI